MNYRKLITVPIAMIMLFVAVPGFAADVNELERRLNIVSDELDRIKNSGGSGGGLASRTSVHGYGEVHWAAAIEDSSSKVDHHRFVIGVHSEITNWIHLNAEIDFEHAGQTIEWEFGYLDFMLSDSLNVRAGTMLVPMGNLNEFHEPNLFYTVERPDFHKKLMPSSWQQTGAGIWGAKGDISYRLYLTNALQSLGDNGRKFDNESFVREGRTDVKGIEVGNLAVTGRVEKKAPGGQAGFSFYYGGSTGGRISEDGAVTMLMADYKTKRGPWDVDLGVFSGTIEDAKEINAACDASVVGSDCSNVPKSAFGLLGTFAVHIPELMKVKTTHDIIAFVQYQKLRPNDDHDGESYGEGNNYDVLAFGASYMPHPNVAIKATYGINYYGGEAAANAKAGAQGTEKNYFDLGVAYQY